MKSLVRTTFAALALALCAAAPACTPFHLRTPDGFARISDPRPSYDYRALSAYGVAVGVRAIPNRENASIAFWSEAVDRRLQRGGAYRPAGASDVRTERGQVGKSLRYSMGDPQNGGTYWVTVFVTRDWVYLVEAGGASASFARAQGEVERAIRSFEGG
jgi:hypothetical protein